MIQEKTQFDKIEQEKALHYSNFKSGASWYFWLAAITVVNLIIRLTNPESTVRFAIGLSISKYLENNQLSIFANIQPRTISLIMSLIFVFVMVILGFLARKRNKVAYIIGIVLYALDIIPAVMIGDLYAVIFHVIVLGFLVWGLVHLFKLEKLEAEYPDEEEEVIVVGNEG